MKSILYQDLAPEDRLKQIKAEAVKVTVEEFEKPLSEEEYDSLKDEQSILALAMFKLDMKKKKFLDELNGERKPKEIKHKQVLQSMNTRTMMMEGDIYSVPDHENNTMYFVDDAGNVIQARGLTQEEKQLSFHISSIENNLNKAVNE
jgi:hypothetical protein